MYPIRKYQYIILLTISILIAHSCSTKHTAYISVPQSDGISFDGIINHLWVGTRNPIYINTPGKLVAIWTDNGQIIHDTTAHSYIEYSIKPNKKGSVKIFTSYATKNNSNSTDTITHYIKFKAIDPPRLNIRIDTTLLRSNSILKYDIINEDTSKPLMNNKRYGYGGLIPPISVFLHEDKIGDIEFYHEDENKQNLLRKGNRISIPPIAIYDSKTGLYIFTNTYDYKYK